MASSPPEPNRVAPLPRLRRKRRVDLPRLVGRFSKGVAEVESHVDRYARRWDAANEQARHLHGPLWVALGDSSTQGVGASAWENGWTHIVLDRLRTRTGEPWRIVNLAMSGGRFLDVAERQIPVLESKLALPDLVTCVVGSNDLMWRRNTDAILGDARAAVDALPAATFVSKLNGPGPRPKLLNEIFAEGEAAKNLHLFNIWNWPSGRGALATDRVHPSDIGYSYMAELAWAAIEGELAL